MSIEETKIKGYMKELSKGAVWIGEDGNAACVSRTKNGALTKFRTLMRQDVGDWEAKEITLKDVGVGYLFLPEQDDRDEYGDEYEWFVSYTKKSPYKVWTFRS